MIQLNPENTTHFFIFIPRFAPIDVLILQLYKEETQQFSIVDNSYVYENGLVTISFDLNVFENDSFQVKILQGEDIIYRDKFFVTEQETQNYKATKDLYYYE